MTRVKEQKITPRPIRQTIVDWSDYQTAEQRWLKYHKGKEWGHFRQWLIGHATLLYTGSNDISLPPQAAHKVKLLCGPHYHALLRAWEINGV